MKHTKTRKNTLKKNYFSPQLRASTTSSYTSSSRACGIAPSVAHHVAMSLCRNVTGLPVHSPSTFFYALPRYCFKGATRRTISVIRCHPRFVPFRPQFPPCRVLRAVRSNLIPPVSCCSERFPPHSNRKYRKRKGKLRTMASHFKADTAAVSI